MTTNLPFKVNPELTGIALAYKNTDYIADEILPRVPVTKSVIKYNKYPKGQFFTVPKSEIGRKGEAESMEYKYSEELASLTDYSLKAEVPQKDVMEAQADGGIVNPMVDNTLLVTEGLKLSREKRVADLIFNTSTYNGNVTSLTTSDSFANANSSFLDVYDDVLKKMDMPPNYAVISNVNALKLKRHPEFLAMYKGDNANNKGMVPLDFIAEQLGLKKIIVGTSRANSVKAGKNPVIQNLWGDDMAFFYQNPLAKPQYGLTFGLTAQKGTTEVHSYFDEDKGSYGLNVIRPVETMAELILCAGCGYLVKGAFVK